MIVGVGGGAVDVGDWGSAHYFFKFFNFIFCLNEKVTLGGGLFDDWVIEVRVHGFHRCVTLIFTFKLSFDGAIDWALFAEFYAPKIRP